MVKRLVLMATLALALLGAPAMAFADEGEIRIEYTSADHRPLAAVEFRAYEVGAVEAGSFMLNEPLAASATSFDVIAADEEAERIKKLSQAVEAAAIAPSARATTDEEGMATLGPLMDGVYLVEGDECSNDAVKISPQAFLARPGDAAYPKPVSETVQQSDPTPEPDEPASSPEDVANEGDGGLFAKTADGWAFLGWTAIIAGVGGLGLMERARRLRSAGDERLRKRRLW